MPYFRKPLTIPDLPSLATERGGSTLSGHSVPAAEIETPSGTNHTLDTQFEVRFSILGPTLTEPEADRYLSRELGRFAKVQEG